MTRRTLLTGLAAVIAAPAIVRASSLMPVKAWREFAIADGTHPSPRGVVLLNNIVIGTFNGSEPIILSAPIPAGAEFYLDAATTFTPPSPR